VRELLCGSKRFNELHRGVPRMSTSLLAQRLRHLEDIGVVRRTRSGNVWEYGLTEAGEALRPIVMALGHWGARWIGSRLRDDELDAGLLMWDMRRFACIDEFPPRAVIIHFSFRDARAGEGNWWLVVEHGVSSPAANFGSGHSSARKLRQARQWQHRPPSRRSDRRTLKVGI
jgi:DNA-binding HxlR family transcriptional regulator